MTAPEGALALVTGAARGIGAQISRRLGALGYRVVLFDLDESGLQETAHSIVLQGGEAYIAVVDITDFSEVSQAIESTLGSSALDVVVNNAGRWMAKAFVESEPEEWAETIAVNFTGTLNVTRSSLSGMIRRGSGRIVNIVSDSARVGEPHFSVYAGAKGAVIGWSKSLAKEVGRFGITVNCVSLSTTLTPGARETFDESQVDKMVKRYPMGRLGQPDDAAGAVLYLVGPDAGWVTGQVLSVNGGYAMV